MPRATKKQKQVQATVRAVSQAADDRRTACESASQTIQRLMAEYQSMLDQWKVANPGKDPLKDKAMVDIGVQFAARAHAAMTGALQVSASAEVRAAQRGSQLGATRVDAFSPAEKQPAATAPTDAQLSDAKVNPATSAAQPAVCEPQKPSDEAEPQSSE
jgi:hypothetical protein